jgi:hypothetical protein
VNDGVAPAHGRAQGVRLKKRTPPHVDTLVRQIRMVLSLKGHYTMTLLKQSAHDIASQETAPACDQYLHLP